MRIVCFEPKLFKDYKNGWSSEEVWKVYYKHWGLLDNKTYDQIQIFTNLFKDKGDRIKEVDNYIAAQISSRFIIKQEEIDELYLEFSDDIEKWKKLQKESNLFYNSVCEFVVKTPFQEKYIRCSVLLGKSESIQTINLKWFFEVQWLKVKCFYLNIKLKQYYKKHPFKYYKNYYHGIEKDRIKLFQNISVTLSNYFKIK